jgi:hypothetical protein
MRHSLRCAIVLSLLSSCGPTFPRGAVAVVLRKVCEEAANAIEASSHNVIRDSSIIVDASSED